MKTIVFIIVFYGCVAFLGACAAFLIYHNKTGWGWFVFLAIAMVLCTSFKTSSNAKCPECGHNFVSDVSEEQACQK